MLGPSGVKVEVGVSRRAGKIRRYCGNPGMKASMNSAKNPSVTCIDCVAAGIAVLLIGKVEVMSNVRPRYVRPRYVIRIDASWQK